MAYQESLVGKVIGNYEILRELGRGGMGVVYKAHEQSLQRVVALKVLPVHLAQDTSFVKRFEREARSSARLTHPNIVTIYAMGEQDGMYYIAMEYVKGETVSSLVKNAGRLDVDRALDIVAQVADALALAHKNDIIHRDIKPQNVMLDEAGRVKVMDFGLAKMLADSGTQLTSQGTMMGTPRYMSPEQCQDLDVDARTDLYSLGVMLFEMLAGQPPFVAETPIALIRKIVETSCPRVDEMASDISQEVVAMVSKMVAHDPDERYGSAEAVATDLRSYLTGQAPAAIQAAPPPRRGDRTVALESAAIGKTLVATEAPAEAPADESGKTHLAAGGPVRRRGGLWKGAIVAVMVMVLICVSVFVVSARSKPDPEEGDTASTAVETESTEPPDAQPEPVRMARETASMPPAPPGPALARVEDPLRESTPSTPGASALEILEEARSTPAETEPSSTPTTPAPAEPVQEPQTPPDQTSNTPEPVEVARAETEPVAADPPPAQPPAPKADAPSGPKDYAGGRFQDRGDGTVKDTDSGLMWQKADSGTLYGTPRPGRSTDYRQYADDLSLAGRSWRIPTKAELLSLQIDEFDGQPLPFQNSGDGHYWCFAPGGRGTLYMFFNWDRASFTTVHVDDNEKCYVRCVTGP